MIGKAIRGIIVGVTSEVRESPDHVLSSVQGDVGISRVKRPGSHKINEAIIKRSFVLSVNASHVRHIRPCLCE